ncbi:WG repeat-containing protein [Chitinophagaceae bacterium LWZ2-11]
MTKFNSRKKRSYSFKGRNQTFFARPNLITAAMMVVLLFSGILTFAQKQKKYLVSYTDSSSGEELVGYKSRAGEIVIKAQYGEGSGRLYKMALVRTVPDWKWLGIDKKGNIMLEAFIYDNGPDYVKEGLFRFVENDKMGFANLDGDKIIPANYSFVTPFESGIAKYTMGGHKERDGEHWFWTGGDASGYLNKFGQVFREVGDLKNNKREARTTDGKHVLLNKNGQVIKIYNK